MTTLFDRTLDATAPLSERMRPSRLADYVGQRAVLAEGSPLLRAIREDRIPSMILWGPPGTGKTTLARALAAESSAEFVPFSAVLSGTPELRKTIEHALEQRRGRGKRTILFVDEIHRWNKAQQDALLPHVENGTVILVGATTENPSFALNAALLSRARVVRLDALSIDSLHAILRRALEDDTKGLGGLGLTCEDEVLMALADAAGGDARRALDLLELAARTAVSTGHARLSVEGLDATLMQKTLRHDKGGDQHYDVVSAMIKSMRGNDPDAAMYWMMRLLEAGDDPRFVARRLVIFASEDVGNADPQALQVAIAADEAFRRLGMPEGLHPLAQACTYLASTVKSNASYTAFTRARQAIAQHGTLPVPNHLRNAPTRLLAETGASVGYRVPHDEGGHAVGVTYLPEELVGSRFYEPTNHGFESKLKARLERLRASDDEARRAHRDPPP